MKAKLCHVSWVAAIVVVAGLADSARAQTVLIDFGNNNSFRGASVSNPDSNGHFWTSMQPGLFYTNLVDINNVGTGINFGFSTPVGTDSFNGPAGVTANTPLTPAEVAAADIDAAALGNLGIKAAAVDFAAEINTRFEIQNLDPAKRYTLTFFGSHKFSTSPTTVYTVFSDNTYTVPVGTALLNVQDPSAPNLHNRDTVATISNLAPQASNILYVQFTGLAPNTTGYLNDMQILGVPEPSSVLLLASFAFVAIGFRRR
jgi:PEP-CTERM motif-containing protein